MGDLASPKPKKLLDPLRDASGLGYCLRAGKTRSKKNACKSRRLPHIGCTLCWARPCFQAPILAEINVLYRATPDLSQIVLPIKTFLMKY